MSIVGKRFGKLIVKGWVSVGRWRCECDCGQERIVDIVTLRNGSALDCQSNKNGNKCALRRSLI